MKIVNGYVCNCSTEERLAKRGIDPENPHNDPVKQQELDEKRGKLKIEPIEETQLGGLETRQNPFDIPAVDFGGGLAAEVKRVGADRTASEYRLNLLV